MEDDLSVFGPLTINVAAPTESSPQVIDTTDFTVVRFPNGVYRIELKENLVRVAAAQMDKQPETRGLRLALKLLLEVNGAANGTPFQNNVVGVDFSAKPRPPFPGY